MNQNAVSTVDSSASLEEEPEMDGAASTPTSSSDEAMFRTRVLEPRYVVRSTGNMRERVLWIATAAPLVIGAGLGVWIYRRRQQRARLDARVRRTPRSVWGALLGGVAAGLVIGRRLRQKE